MVLLLLWCSLACVAAISNGAANTITVLSDGNKTNCSTNSSGTFCYSLSYAMNHLITDNTTVLLASPKIDVLDRISVSNVSNIVLQGLGIDNFTVICYYQFGIDFSNVSGLTISNLTIQLCSTTPIQHEMDLRLNKCSNITIDNVKIARLTNGGLTIYCPSGYIRVSHSIFERSNSTRAGVNVSTCWTQRKIDITFENCTFFANHNNGMHWSTRVTGHGGGLLLVFENATNVHTSILNCNFTNNRAPWSGGLFVGFKSHAVNNTLVVKDTVFVNNTAKQGAGGMGIGFYKFADRSTVRRNNIYIKNVTFRNNNATFGGGTTIFTDLSYQISHQQNNVTFSKSKWISNVAHFSTAVDISPTVYDNVVGGFPLATKFKDCSFIGNRVLAIHKNNNEYHIRSGTIMITALPVCFGGETNFRDNVGTALHVVASKVMFDWWSNTTFANNSGNLGGALALVGMATLLFDSNSIFLFENNHADFVGGAIYWYSVDQHDYFSSRTCFLKKEYKTENVSFMFINNTASSLIGHSIYATTLLPCRHSCEYNFNHALEEVFSKCVANFSFIGHGNTNQVATFGTKLEHAANALLKVIPGIVVPLNATVYDEGNHNVTNIIVFQNSIMRDSNNSNIELAPSYKYSSLGEVKILGRSGNTGKLLVKIGTVHGVSTVVNFEVIECPPGFVLNDTSCQCDQDEYFGIECRFSDAYIRKGYWAGYLDVNNATGPTPANLWTGECPLAFCSYGGEHTKEQPLPKTANKAILDKFICGSNRAGDVCGQCREGFSVFFHSKLYSCKQVTPLCNYGILFYFLSDILPLTLLFIAILVMNISFTSGAVNGFILFAQVIDLLYIDANGLNTSSWFVFIYQFIYGFFNLDFFSGETLSFCLWEGATVLDVLIFKYLTTVFAVVLVFGLVVIVNYCTCWRICKCFRKQGFNVSVIQGLSAFLVMAYSQSTRVTFEILQLGVLRNGISANSSVKYVVHFAGNVEYFSWQHGYYVIPALVFLVFIVILPPSLLLVNPVLIKCAAFFQSRNYCSSSRSMYWLNKLLLIDLKPLFDSFQGCFKDNWRCFSGIYFLYRFVILLIRVFFPNIVSFYLVTEFFLVFFLVFHSSVQPYQKRWHNVLDTVIFGNLVILNAFSLFLNYQSKLQSELSISNTFIHSIQLILIYWPMFYILAYAIIVCFVKYRKRFNVTSQRFITKSKYILEDEMPARLLADSSDSYGSF